MFRYLRALWYFCTGRFSAAAEALASNEYVTAATYDAAIDKSGNRYQTVRNAVAKLVGIEQERVAKIKTLTEKFQELERVKKGAWGKGKILAEQLQSEGQTLEQIRSNPDYLRHMAAFQNAATSAKDVERDSANRG